VKPSYLSDGIHRIEASINKIQTWASKNILKLNQKKTEFIVFGTSKQLSNITTTEILINGEQYQLKQVIRNLGVFLDSNLKLSYHIDRICRSSYANLRMLRALRTSVTNGDLAILSHALVLSKIEYAPAVLYGVEDKQLKKLQRVIKSTFRLCYRFKKHENISEEMKRLGWLSITERISMRLMLILHTVVTYKEPFYLWELIDLASSDRNMRSQSRGDLVCHGSRTSVGSRSFAVAAPKIWNLINVETRNIQKHDCFHYAIRRLFLNV
jgi:hypothetical protein